jgi:uncharacterized tellurite resistance protein B-like protein
MIASIISTLKKPGGFRQISPLHRRQLIAAILASVIPCDGKVLDVEIKRLCLHLATRLNFSKAEIDDVLHRRGTVLAGEDFAVAARSLAELLGKEDLAMLVSLMWDIAMCDQDLHPLEEHLVYRLADAAGLARKLVIQQQARAASANNAA